MVLDQRTTSLRFYKNAVFLSHVGRIRGQEVSCSYADRRQKNRILGGTSKHDARTLYFGDSAGKFARGLLIP